MIEGLNYNCTVGPVDVYRSPLIELTYKRRAVLTRCVIEIPDPKGEIRGQLSKDQPISLQFDYRGKGMKHTFEGFIDKIDQPDHDGPNIDAIVVRGVGKEKSLLETKVKESFRKESTLAVAKRLMAMSGLPLGTVDIPDEILPHQIFSNVTIARALKQIEHTLVRQFDHDMTKHAVWLGESGLMWSPEKEPGDVYVIATAENLIDHVPPVKDGEMGAIMSSLLPGLKDSMEIRIEDKRRGVNSTERAEEVIHTLREYSNMTTVMYGKKTGWS